MTGPQSPKIIPFETAREFFGSLRDRGTRVVLSHGIFDLIHPGHIAHLENARMLGDVLAVSLTADKHVHKGPGRPYFNEQLRLKSLAALQCVDYVVLTPHPTATEAIVAIRPDVYCKGKEYEDPEHDVTGGLQEEMRAVDSVGGQVRFVGSIKFSSTKLLNLYFDHASLRAREFCAELSKSYTRKALREAVDSLGQLRVLVVGEVIFDRYTTVRVQGLTSKSRVLSGRFLHQATHCGGALAAVRHVLQLTQNARFLSIVGTEPWVEPMLSETLGRRDDLIIQHPNYTTIIKERFVEPRREGERLTQLFAVNFIDPEPPQPPVLEEFEKRLVQAAAECDAVMLLDFGHGLMTPRLRQVVEQCAPYLILNCQTNSNNYGFNIISRQYRRADAFALDEQEMLLSAGQRNVNFEQELRDLKQQLGANYAWLTRGPVQTLGLTDDQSPCACPPIETEVVDPLGAGDAFFAVAGLSAARRLPIDLATFLGQLAGAQAVRVVGNERPISKQILIKSGMSLLDR